MGEPNRSGPLQKDGLDTRQQQRGNPALDPPVREEPSPEPALQLVTGIVEDEMAAGDDQNDSAEPQPSGKFLQQQHSGKQADDGFPGVDRAENREVREPQRLDDQRIPGNRQERAEGDVRPEIAGDREPVEKKNRRRPAGGARA